MDRTTIVTPVDPYVDRPWSRVSWGAVLAGSLVAIMVMLLINLLTLGIGLQSIDPATEARPLAGLGTGTTIGVIIANVVALFLGGWVAGRVAGVTTPFGGVLHGILTWGLVTLLSFLLLSSAVGSLVSGVTGAIGQGLSLAGQGVAAVAPEAAQAVEDALAAQGVDLDDIREEGAQLIAQATEGEVEPEDAAADAAQDIARDPQAAGRRLDQLIGEVFGDEPSDSVDRDDVVAVLVENGMSQAEAEETVANWEQTAQEARERLAAVRQDLEEAAQSATDAIGNAAIWAFFGLILGAIIAMAGSAAGRPKTVLETREV